MCTNKIVYDNKLFQFVWSYYNKNKAIWLQTSWGRLELPQHGLPTKNEKKEKNEINISKASRILILLGDLKPADSLGTWIAAFYAFLSKGNSLSMICFFHCLSQVWTLSCMYHPWKHMRCLLDSINSEEIVSSYLEINILLFDGRLVSWPVCWHLIWVPWRVL